MGQITNNAIGWVQFRVAGGLKSSILLAVGYVMVMIAICSLIVMVNAGRPRSLDAMPQVFLAIQGVIVGAITLFRIFNAVQRDLNAKVMESHRLMPIDPRLAVLGYAAGGGMSVVPIVVANLLLGGVAAGHAGLPMNWWLWANGVLLSWCVFAWCIAAGASMFGAGIGMLILAPLLILLMTGGAIALVVPGLMPLGSPLVGRTIWLAQQVDSELLVRWVTCMALQLPVAWIIILAGARRFRWGDVPGFTGPLGCALVLVVAIASIVTMRDAEMLPRHLGHSTPEPKQIGTLMALMILGAITVLAHVARHTVEFHGRYRGKACWLRDGAVVLVILLAPVVYLAAVPDLPDDWRGRACWSLIEITIVIVAVLLWARWMARQGTPLGIAMVAAGIWWVLPLLAGTIVDSSKPWHEFPSAALQFSPLGMLSAIWNSSGNSARVSILLAQLVAPAIGAALLFKGRKAEEASSFTDSPAPVDSSGL